MPFKNCKQVRAMYLKAPSVARRWVKEYGLPKGCGKKRKS